MRPKLKEDPKEWQKFMLALAIFACAVSFVLQRKGRLPINYSHFIWVGSGLILAASLIRPRWFRGLYRAIMTGSFYVGQTIGKIILTLFFLLALTPLGWLLRLLGKDLLGLKKNPHAASYWQTAKSSREFDRMY